MELSNFNYIYLLLIGFGFGIAVLAFYKSFSFAPVALGQSEQDSSALPPSTSKKKKITAVRNTNLLSLLPNGAVRLRGGGYMRGFVVKPANSLWSSNGEVDKLFDDIAGMITSKLPAGTAFQFRWADHPENTNFFFDKKMELLVKETNEQAKTVKSNQIDYLTWLSQRGDFNRSNLTVWIYLPLVHKEDKQRNPLWEFANNTKSKGVLGAIKALGSSERIVKRTIEEERELIKEAEEYFEAVERLSPLELERIDRDTMWKSLYYSYNETAESNPPPPTNPLTDLKVAVCSGEPIKSSDNWYLLHGNTPVTMITLFLPPESSGTKQGCYAGMCRGLANNNWDGRYTVLTEFITLDKDQVEKDLSWRKWRLEKTSNRPSGKGKLTKKRRKALEELDSVEEDLLSPDTRLVKARLRIVVYGNPARSQEELTASTEELNKISKDMIAFLQRHWKGADVGLESAEALHSTYEQTLLGNMELKGSTGREIEERADSLVALVPAEDVWGGMNHPHSYKRSPSGKFFGVNFWEMPHTKSPLVVVLGASGAGKSVEMGTYCLDVLAEKPKARVKIVDFGETYATFCECVGGKHFRFTPDENRPINIWDYAGLSEGDAPEEPQINLVVEDAAILAGIDTTTEAGRYKESILRRCVVEVYKDIVPRNRTMMGRKYEPILTDLIDKLCHFPFQNGSEIDVAAEIASLLSNFKDHPWLDAPTHPTFKEDSPLEVYEMDSLHLFPQTIRKALAFRTGSRVIRSIGEKIDGEYTPMLLVFDEMHEYEKNPDLQVIFKAQEKGARKGRKTNVVTMLGTHGYKDLSHLHGLTDTAGMFIVGQQDDIGLLKEKRLWTDQIEKAVLSVKTEPGSYSQFVINAGKAESQMTEMIQSDLSPQLLWTMTSDPNERNAREKVKNYFRQFDENFSMLDAVLFLADAYPRGLTYIGKSEIDDFLLPTPINVAANFTNQIQSPSMQEESFGLETSDFFAENIAENEKEEELLNEFANLTDTDLDQIFAVMN